MLKDKYNMTEEQNIFFAKRNIVDMIWKSSHIEGIDVTFPETQQIYDGGNVSKLRIDEIQTINNLKHAWIYVLNSLESDSDLNLLKSINSLVGSNLIDNAGKMRIYKVKVGGTNWIPDIPDEKKTQENIENILNLKDKTITEKAIELMCYLMRTQFFNDGNKRTAILFANKIMIQNGKGTISIPVEKDAEFGEKLIKYYETDDMEELKQFIYKNCIDGYEK